MTFKACVDTDVLDHLLAPFDTTSAPGFALGVAVDGVPRYRRGVGLASVELPVPLSPSIRMRIGSTSKHFCVLAVMLLQEQGLISIEDSPRTVLTELPAWTDEITIKQLMSHTSGLRDSLDLLLLATGPGQPTAADTQFKLMAALDSVNFAPGTSWNYNNGGYVLLSVIVERVSGMPLADFLRTRIFEPLGMADTLLRLLDTDLLPNSATLHLPNSAGGWTRGVFGPPLAGEGGIASTIDDMLRWLKHMSAPTIGSTQSWAAMRTPQATHGYGLGLMMTEHRGLRTVNHAGGLFGGSCQMLKVLDAELDIVLITNGQSAMHLYRLVDDIIDACIPGLPPVAPDAGGPPVVGTFFSAGTGRVVALAEHDGAQIMDIGGMPLPAKRDAAGRMSVAILPTDLKLQAVRNGDEVLLEATEFGVTDRLERVEPRRDERAIEHGTYVNVAAGLSAVVADGEMQIHGFGSVMEYALEPIGPALWKAMQRSIAPMTLTLEIQQGAFLLTSGRTVRLRFELAA